MHPEDFFVLRTPLLPFEVAESLSDALEARAALDDRDRLEAALDRDRARIRARLRALVSEPAIREAIFVASPDLDRAIDRWIEEPGAARGTEVEGALFRYVLRMAARPTPFGLFAGCGVGAIGDTTALTVSARDGCRRHTRLDMDYLVQLADVLAREPALAPSVIYTPNSSLSRVAGRWRYVETRLRQGYGGQARAHQGYGGQARAHQGDGGQARAHQGDGGQARAHQGDGGQARAHQGDGGQARAHQGDGGQARAHQGDGGQARTRQGDDGQARTRQGDGGQAGSGTGEAERSHHLVALEDSDHLDATIERARPGATRAALAEALAGGGVNRAEADAFVGELIDSQILVPDVECPITGPEPLARLEALARRHPDAGAIAERLGEVAARLRAIDEGGLGAPRSRYHDIAAELEPLGAPVEISRLFQVDLIRPASFASLGRDLADEVVRGVAVLRRLAPRIEPGELDRFRTAFADRYEQREVPLAEALDEETGVGSALGDSASRDVSALLGGLDFPAPSIESTVWSRREATLLHRVGETLVAGGHELTLTPGDIEAMASDDGAPLPDAWSALATIVRPCGETANGAGVRVMLHHSSGPSGAPLLGRFCHGDPALLAAVRDHLRAEEALDREAVFAEVVHLPHGRTGNILLRPELRQYEVPYLGRSGVPADRQIPIDDLTVALSDGRFVLRSRRLGRRVVPRLTTAHNFIAGSLTLYRFFCLLQSDGRLPWCGWSWGALASLPFLPRVTFGRLVFSRATWRVTRDEARPLITASGAARFAAVQAWRVSRRLRRWILLVEHDNLLPLDLDNVSAVDELVRQLKDRESAVLMEMYPGPGELCASGDDGRYTHEVLIPFHGEALPQTARHVSSGHHRAGLKQGLPPVSSCPAPPPHHAKNAWQGPRPPGLQRTFAPGSEWIFAKLYSGTGTADRLLTETIGPVSRTLLAKEKIDRWFFIRYADPHQHLRWRLHVPSGTRLAGVQRRVERAAAALIEDGRVHRVVFDTYEREVERYGGGAGMELVEQYFCADSEAIVELLASLDGADAAGDRRWHAAIPGVNMLLADLGLDLDARLMLMRTLRERFGREFRADAAFGRQLAARFRRSRAELDRLLVMDESPPDDLRIGPFARRSTRARPALDGLRAANDEGRLTWTLAGLAESLVHMHLNRLFRSEQRAHELVIYDFLACLYEARVARGRSGTR